MKASGGLYPVPLKILEIVKKNVGGKKVCISVCVCACVRACVRVCECVLAFLYVR